MRGTMILLFFEKKPNKIWTIGKKSLPLHTLLEKSADKAVRMRKQLSWQSTTLPRLGSRVRVSFSAQHNVTTFLLKHIFFYVKKRNGLILPRWRNWQTRTFQVRVPQGVQVRVLFWALHYQMTMQNDGEVAELVDALL